jgi:hypothetical protein
MKSTLSFLFIIAACSAFSPSVNSKQRSLRSLQLEAQTEKRDTRDVSKISSSRRNVISVAALTAISAIPATNALAATTSAASFVGTYSDPINHPGGKRTIKLLDSPVPTGDYTLAQVYGGGGVGEPKEYVLPAIILGDRAIIIDFSPKGGPRDFTGVLEKDGSIKFLRDGNRWPRLE